MLPRHTVILLCGEVRYVHGLVVAGADGATVAGELTRLLASYSEGGDSPERDRLRQLLGQLQREIEDTEKGG